MNFTKEEERILLSVLDKMFGLKKEELEEEVSDLSTSYEYRDCNVEHIEYIENELAYLKSISSLIVKIGNDFDKEI